MNMPTGHIGTMEELQGRGFNLKDMIAIEKEQMTAQQELYGYVALNDSNTPLGKLRTSRDPLTKNQEKKRRQKQRT